jgi:cold shock CspA family protein
LNGTLSSPRWFSTTSTPDSGSVDSEFVTGTVKFYLRDRLFGFITADDPLKAGAAEIWVHRTSIDCPHSFEEFPNRPYLYKNERVKFRVVPAEGETQTPKAIDLRFENGRQVPLFRKK